MLTALLRYGPPARRFLLGGSLVVLPAAMLPYFANDPINTPKISLLIAIVGVVLGVRLIEIAAGASAADLTRAAVPALALAVPLTIAWLPSGHRSWELFGLYPRYLGLIPYLATVLLAVLLADAFAGRAGAPAWCLLLGGGLVGLYGLLQVAQVDPVAWDAVENVAGIQRTTSTFGNPNFSGAFLAIVTPVGLVLALRGPGRRDWAWVLTAVTAFGLVTSFSQGPWLAGAGGTAVALGYLLRRRWRRLLQVSLAIAAVCGLISTGAVVSTILSEAGADLFGPTVESRGWFWETAASMTAEAPLLGWGPNVFAAEGIRFRPADEGLVAYWIAEDPHNLVLGVAVNAGLLGLGGLAVIIVWAARRSRRALAGADPIAAAFAAGVVAYALSSLVGVDEPGVRVAGWSCLAGLGAAAAKAPERHREARRRSPRSPVVAALLAVVGTAAAIGAPWFATRLLVADRSQRLGVLAAQDNLPELASRRFRAALDLRDEYGYRRTYGTRIGEQGTRLGPEGAEYVAEMRSAFAYLDSFPDISGLVAEARLLLAWGEKADPSAYAEALARYEQARALDPHHPLIAVETSDALRAMQRADDALELLMRFSVDGDGYASYHGALALTYLALGDVDAARGEIGRALELDENDSRARLALQRLADTTS